MRRHRVVETSTKEEVRQIGIDPGFYQPRRHTRATQPEDVDSAGTTTSVDAEMIWHTCLDCRYSVLLDLNAPKHQQDMTHDLRQGESRAHPTDFCHPYKDLDFTPHTPESRILICIGTANHPRMLCNCRQANLFAGEPQRRNYTREALVVFFLGGRAQNWCGFRVDGDRARDSREERESPGGSKPEALD